MARSDRWISAYVVQVPAGLVEVRHIDQNPGFYPTQVIVDTDETADLYVGRGATRYLWRATAGTVRFQLENDPILPTVWEVQNNPQLEPAPDGGTVNGSGRT